MKQILALFLAAAVGSAATFLILSPKAPAPVAEKAVVTAPAAVGNSPFGKTAKTEESSGAEKTKENRFPNQIRSMLADVEGVSAEDMAKIRVAFMRTFSTSEEVKAARAHLMELGKQAEFASDQEKRDMKADFDEATEAVRKTLRTAIMENDPSLSEETINTVIEAMEQRRRQQFSGQKKK